MADSYSTDPRDHDLPTRTHTQGSDHAQREEHYRREYDDDDNIPLHPGFDRQDARNAKAPPHSTDRYDEAPQMRDMEEGAGTYQDPYARQQYRDMPTERAPSIDEPPPGVGNQLTRYDEEKAYAEWYRGEEEREARRQAYYERPPVDTYEQRPPRDYYEGRDRDRGYDRDSAIERRRQTGHSRGQDEHRRYEQEHRHKDDQNNLAGTLIGGGAGALLGRELVGKGPLGVVGGAVVGALAAKGVENWEDKKRREKDEERRRIRREYDSESYDPRGSSRSSNYYDPQHSSPAPSTYNTARLPPSRRSAPRRARRKYSESSDSFTSDD